MKTMHKITKLSLALIMIVIMIASLSMLSGAASDKYKPIFTEKYGTLDYDETFEYDFSLEYTSVVKINVLGEGEDTWGETCGDYTIEIKNSLSEIVYTVSDYNLWDYEEYLTTDLPAGDYKFILYCNGDEYDELDYCVSLSYKVTEVFPVESVSINKSQIYLCPKDKITLSAEIMPTYADGKVVWTSSDTSIATVSSSGVVKGVAKGKATITATAGDKKATCKVTVLSTEGKSYKNIVPTQKGTIDPGETKTSKFTLKTYSKVKIYLIDHDSNFDYGTYGRYEITIKNSAGEVVYNIRSSSGYDTKSHVTPVLTKDTYTFILSTYYANDYYTDDLDYIYKISYMTVTSTAVKKVKLDASTVTLAKGKTKTLTATPDPSYLTNTVTWSSSNTKVATVNSEGKITAKALGTATITAKIGSKKATCKVKVSSMSATVIKKKSTKLASYITNISGYKSAKWSSSKTSIATVDSTGKVTGKAYGTCSIYCTINGTKYTFNVTVKPAVSITPSYINDDDIYNDAGIKFTNNTNLDVTYITLNIYQYDNRGYRISSPYDYYYLDYTLPAKSSDTYEFWVNDSTRKFTCSITKVWFSDGSTWTP